MSGADGPLRRDPVQPGAFDLSAAKRPAGRAGPGRDRNDIQHFGNALRPDPPRLRAPHLVAHGTAVRNNTSLQHGRVRAGVAQHPHPHRLSPSGRAICRWDDKADIGPAPDLPRPAFCAWRHTPPQPLVRGELKRGLQNRTPPCSFSVRGVPKILPTWLKVTGFAGGTPVVPKLT